MGLIKKLRKAKKEAPPNEKPAVVKTHLRNMIIVPEMIGSVIGIYNGKLFNSVEIKPEMTGHYLAEFSCSYRPVKHGRPGVCLPLISRKSSYSHPILRSVLLTRLVSSPSSNCWVFLSVYHCILYMSNKIMPMLHSRFELYMR